ncbi:Mu transposase C-terminal domain-containing protein [Aestuariirhabdus litorea]|uniref:Integrase catalytic domain-containing protein n=1 Tax=Aestuariirhabdus litorea TaxID=2528527 RepID=A0A3P3VLJ9_9GAMM|nr:Mu transposase C-terminal domain-containing protein [Aestuariirhabdus litorea]RRJ82596.1 hypothetical protein D0544_12075 [Aestuariirhabdus litorea]RWW92755.1 hypothetical protein DZC74_12050 [Endozoicomonadaceae bacterium GTF-13]
MFNSLVRDTPIALKGEKYVIDKNLLSANRVTVCQPESGIEVSLSYDELSHYFAKGELVFERQALDVMEKNGYDLSESKMLLLSDERKKDILRKKGYVNAISNPDGSVIKGIDNQLEKIAEHAKKEDPFSESKGVPSLSSVRRWHARIRASKDNVLSLDRRPRTRSKTNPENIEKNHQDELTRELFNLVTEKHYWKQNKVPVTHIPVLMTLEKADKERYRGCSVPSLSTMYRWLSTHSAFDKKVKHEGWLAAKRAFPSGVPVVEATYLMEAVELDHTQLDINVIDEDTKEVLGRPWLTVFLDKKSRMVVGLFLSMSTPSARSVVKAYRNMVLSKDYVKHLKGVNIESEWPCMGMPDQVITDNGRDLHASEVQRVMGHLGEIVYLPKGSPQLKGRVERFFRSLNEGLFHSKRGTTFSNYSKCGDYKSKKEAIYTLSQVNVMIHKWVVDVYHTRVHKALGESPLTCWQGNKLSQKIIRLPNSITEIDELLWIIKQRTIQKDGISIEGLKYNSKELMGIMREKGLAFQVDVFVDEEDLRLVRVVVPGTTNTIDVPCTYTTYIEKVKNLKSHQEVRKSALSKRRQEEKLSEQILLRAQKDLQDMERKAKSSKRKTSGTRKKKAAAGDSEKLTGTQPIGISKRNRGKIKPVIESKKLSDIKKVEAV